MSQKEYLIFTLLRLIKPDIVRMVVLFFVLPMFNTSVGVQHFCVLWLL